ncbi:Tetrahydrofolate dehydrogenase/cyclohydrolase [Roseimaritima multifibrata]|uniref:Bifunctional protein FolD n=1 Tax=Roseimaritima multifibrata TaxID=1930274 RepID=A0A517MK82_9BACT|nr:bifunctional methylenetetrahydrofolate dehydrogenase/methenyltetrahydrofolate cyclohydrolase FolD [Roseimaritima multifibrata]QDS95274.1 Tetrahydrofolate dehydrogenase/cyclohydrolase [Roseimaritima multifibrata]
MSAQILDGKQTALAIRQEIAEEVTQFIADGGPSPCLVAVLVGEDPASQVYVRNKQRACEKAGIEGRLHRLPADTDQATLMQLVADLNADNSVHGILVQLPLPAGLDEREVLDAIDPAKDVDAFSPYNVGLLMQGRPRFLPCTPAGIVQLLHRYQIEVSGKHVVVVGRSDIVGKPMAMLLVAKDGPCGPATANATVTLAHSRTANLADVIRQADIVVAAVGRPEMIRGEMLKPGAVVIDVGINRVGDRLVGDVCFDEAMQVASAVTPVPGGVGPLTIAMLLGNTVKAAKEIASRE